MGDHRAEVAPAMRVGAIDGGQVLAPARHAAFPAGRTPEKRLERPRIVGAGNGHDVEPDLAALDR